MEWQPIETAPKDGTPILCMMSGGYVVATWCRHRAYKHCWAWMAMPWPKCDFLLAVEPTHWMPLPTAPVQS